MKVALKVSWGEACTLRQPRVTARGTMIGPLAKTSSKIHHGSRFEYFCPRFLHDYMSLRLFVCMFLSSSMQCSCSVGALRSATDSHATDHTLKGVLNSLDDSSPHIHANVHSAHTAHTHISLFLLTYELCFLRNLGGWLLSKENEGGSHSQIPHGRHQLHDERDTIPVHCKQKTLRQVCLQHSCVHATKSL
jgi:hypothetical protein